MLHVYCTVATTSLFLRIDRLQYIISITSYYHVSSIVPPSCVLSNNHNHNHRKTSIPMVHYQSIPAATHHAKSSSRAHQYRQHRQQHLYYIRRQQRLLVLVVAITLFYLFLSVGPYGCKGTFSNFYYYIYDRRLCARRRQHQW